MEQTIGTMFLAFVFALESVKSAKLRYKIKILVYKTIGLPRYKLQPNFLLSGLKTGTKCIFMYPNL